MGWSEPVLRERVSKVMGLAAHHRCDVMMVLGASGYGVFQERPASGSRAFRNCCARRAVWGRFSRMLFSVLDTSRGQPYNTFREYAAAGTAAERLPEVAD